MDKVWTVYGLIDPREGSVFYIGVTTNLRNRISGHMTDPASSAYHVCCVIKSEGRSVDYCVFGKFIRKLPAKILEGRLILALPNLVNKTSFHGLPSSVLYPDWQDLRIKH